MQLLTIKNNKKSMFSLMKEFVFGSNFSFTEEDFKEFKYLNICINVSYFFFFSLASVVSYFFFYYGYSTLVDVCSFKNIFFYSHEFFVIVFFSLSFFGLIFFFNRIFILKLMGLGLVTYLILSWFFLLPVFYFQPSFFYDLDVFSYHIFLEFSFLSFFESIWVQKLLVLSSFCVILLFQLRTSLVSEVKTGLMAHKLPILLFFIYFSLLLVSSENLVLTFVCILGVSICLYTLIAVSDNKFSIESSIKYFSLGWVASGFFMLGSFFFFVEFGSFDYTDILYVYNVRLSSGVELFSVESIGLIFILFTFFFKLSSFPAHFWAPSVSAGSSFFVLPYLLVISKMSLFFALIRFLEYTYFLKAVWQPILVAAAIGSIIFGSLGACAQTNIKRFIAFSSISHIGFMLMGLAFSNGSFSISILYLFIYAMTSIILFIILNSVVNKNGSNIELTYFVELQSLFATSRPKALIFMSIFLSFAGLPPFAGFGAKLGIFFTIVDGSTLGWFTFFSILVFYTLSIINYVKALRSVFLVDNALCVNEYLFMNYNNKSFFSKENVVFVFFCLMFIFASVAVFVLILC